MTDIVERLRARKGFWLNGAAWMMDTKPDPDCAEAADEIERLRFDHAALGHEVEIADVEIERLRAITEMPLDDYVEQLRASLAEWKALAATLTLDDDVTPEMIRVGVDRFDELQEFQPDRVYAVKEIYSAMRRASAKPSDS